MATYSSILAWRVPWTEEPGGLQSIGSQRVRQVKQDLSNYKSDKTEATEQPHSQSIQTVGCKIGLRMYYTTRGIQPRICSNCKWNVGVPSLSCVQPFATSWTVACQASLSMEFSGQEYWRGLPFPSTRDLPDPGIKPGSPALQADSLPPESESE